MNIQSLSQEEINEMNQSDYENPFNEEDEDIDDEAGEREYLKHLYNSGQASDDDKLMLGIIED